MKIVAVSGWKQSGKDSSANYLIEKHGFTRIGFADVLKDMVAEQYKIPRNACDDTNLKEKPLEQYPVLPKDDYSLYIAKYMIGEFRDIQGRKVQDFYVDPSGAFLGVSGRDVCQLYWTPRALCILEGSIKRSVTSTYWTQKAIEKIEKENNTDRTVVKEIDGKAHNFLVANPGRFVISDLRYRSEVDQLRQAFGKSLKLVRINRFDTVSSTDPSERDLDTYKFDFVLDNKGTIEELQQKLTTLIREN